MITALILLTTLCVSFNFRVEYDTFYIKISYSFFKQKKFITMNNKITKIRNEFIGFSGATLLLALCMLLATTKEECLVVSIKKYKDKWVYFCITKHYKQIIFSEKPNKYVVGSKIKRDGQ